MPPLGRLTAVRELTDVAAPRTRFTRPLALCSALLALFLTVGYIATGDAQARVRLPDCGNSYYGGRETPRNWDRGCTGGRDLTGMSWRGWRQSRASGRGRAEGGGVARVLVSRIRWCENQQGDLRRFYTQIRINGRSYRLICY